MLDLAAAELLAGLFVEDMNLDTETSVRVV